MERGGKDVPKAVRRKKKTPDAAVIGKKRGKGTVESD